MSTRIYAAVGNQVIAATHGTDRWTVESSLEGKQPMCVESHVDDPERAFCGTFDDGLWRTTDGGQTWSSIGERITQDRIMSIHVGDDASVDGARGIWVGTEPSALYYSDDGGDSWTERTGLTDLRSEPDWAFPPRPETHHVRWIETDPHHAGQIYVSVEQGAFLRSPDGGKTWNDRVPGSPRDLHTFALHPDDPGRIYGANGFGFIFPGFGYVESRDGGETWSKPNEGLDHQYLWGLAVDPDDPDCVLVSASQSPEKAHVPQAHTSYIYRRRADGTWTQCQEGLPKPAEMFISVLTTHPDESGVFYALSNEGIYRTDDQGRTWERLQIAWTDATAFTGRRGAHVGPAGLSVV